MKLPFFGWCVHSAARGPHGGEQYPAHEPQWFLGGVAVVELLSCEEREDASDELDLGTRVRGVDEIVVEDARLLPGPRAPLDSPLGFV